MLGLVGPGEVVGAGDGAGEGGDEGLQPRPELDDLQGVVAPARRDAVVGLVRGHLKAIPCLPSAPFHATQSQATVRGELCGGVGAGQCGPSGAFGRLSGGQSRCGTICGSGKSGGPVYWGTREVRGRRT